MTGQVGRPAKVDQVAALMLTVFEANPDTRMTRRDIENALDLSLDGVSKSTRERAMYVLISENHIQWEDNWLCGRPSIYWKREAES